jgi:hypothetical protein
VGVDNRAHINPIAQLTVVCMLDWLTPAVLCWGGGAVVYVAGLRCVAAFGGLSKFEQFKELKAGEVL